MKRISKSKASGAISLRAIDSDGNLVDSMLSQKRDMVAAQAFFRQAQEVALQISERVTTDGHDSYPRAIAQVLGADVEHRVNDCLTNRRLAGPSRHQTALLSHARL